VPHALSALRSAGTSLSDKIVAMKAAARILVLLLAAAIAPAVASACPLCKEAKSDTDYPGGTASLPRGFYYSILLMVAAPFAVVGGLGLKIFLAPRRAWAAVSPAQAGSRPPAPAPAAARTLFSLSPRERAGVRAPDSRGAQP